MEEAPPEDRKPNHDESNAGEQAPKVVGPPSAHGMQPPAPPPPDGNSHQNRRWTKEPALLVVNVLTLIALAIYTGYTRQIVIDSECASKRQANEVSVQLAEMRESNRINNLALNSAKSAAETASGQLAEMAKQTPELVKAANAAQSAAETANKTLVDVDRPFLTASIANTVTIPAQVAPAGQPFGTQVPVKISVRNSGKQAAIITSWRVRLWFARNQPPEVPEHLVRDSLVQGPSGPPIKDICVGPARDVPLPIIQPEGDPYPISCNGSFSPHDLELLNLKLGPDGTVWLQWLIEYTDLLGVARQTANTWSFVPNQPDRGERGFTIFGNQTYNYDRRK